MAMLSNSEKGTLIKLFNRGGYVLDLSTADFDAFTMDSVGVPLCETYTLSKGKSLIAYVKDASEDDVYKLLSDLLTYYETQYRDFESEIQETDFFGDLHCSSRFTDMLCDAQAQYGDYSELNKCPMWKMWEKEEIKALEGAVAEETIF